jgi:hypothetical protein
VKVHWIHSVLRGAEGPWKALGWVEHITLSDAVQRARAPEDVIVLDYFTDGAEPPRPERAA